MVFIIVGTKGRISEAHSGTFTCPNCQGPRQYEFKRAERFFTFFFIPLFPIETLGKSVTCKTCNTSYAPAVLDNDPARHRMIAMWRAAIVAVACAFGPASQAQAAALNAALPPDLRASFNVDQILEECSRAPAEGFSIDAIVGRAAELAPFLDLAARQDFLCTAIAVMKAGRVSAGRRKAIIIKLGETFDMSPIHIRGIIDAAG